MSEINDGQMNEPDMESAIDRALQSYTAGEPEPDLAQRIVADLSRRQSRYRKVSGNARAWALAAAVGLACIAIVTLWMKSEHLELALVHTNLVRTEAVRPAVASVPTQPLSGGDGDNPRRRTAKLSQGPTKQRDHSLNAAGDAASQAARQHAAGTSAGDEQLVAEGVEPIVFKPIKMAAIRMEAPSQEAQ